ncbi:MAG: hypothetical protein E7220_08175 [Clostridiales bacterium]|nr:hypothetical protein [Clostridiales bacterium]
MRLIRNFFHNISDIILALVVVVIAAGVIYWRMDIIMDYPKQMAAAQAVYNREDVQESQNTAALDTAEDDGEDSAEEAADAEG